VQFDALTRAEWREQMERFASSAIAR
jgi:hypothetical protein